MKLVSHYRETEASPGAPIINWRENDLGEALYYAYRATSYNRATFPSRLHCHDYFELVIFESGDIHYICEDATYQPQAGDVLLISPGMFHMSRIRCEKTLYIRHVFYLYPHAFDLVGCGTLTGFLKLAEKGLAVFSPEEQTKLELHSLLLKLDKALERKDDPACKALSLGLAIEIFYLLNQSNFIPKDSCTPLPENLSEIRSYIDAHFQQISSVNEVAAHFFYSREYVSRLFRKYFNTTVGEYITARRIAHSKNLIQQGYSILDACQEAGFRNMSTFIRSFRQVTGMSPSEYRKTR